MKHHNLNRLYYAALCVLVSAALTACGGTAATAAPTQPVVVSTPATNVPTAAPEITQTPSVPQPPDVVVSLPPDAAARLDDVASKNGWKLPSLAKTHTVFYAFPDKGIAFLLTPAADAPGPTPDELAAKPKAIDKVILGALTVIQQIHDALPVDDYLMTLAPDGKTVQFTGASAKANFDAVIRSLPLALPRPLALITSSQMCVAWNTTQICALVPTPLRPDLVEQLTGAIKDVGAEPANFSLERAIPDVEGFGMIETCAKALSETPPAYANCRATVLAAPAVADGAFANPPETTGTTTGIGVLDVLEVITDQIFTDPQLTLPTPDLPVGAYRTYEVLLPDETPAPGKPVATRVRQSGLAGDFYLPAVSGGVIIGDPALGFGPSNEEEAIIANLWSRGRCTGWKWWQCPWIH